MQLVKWIATGVLILPLAEIVAFIVVASQIGFAKALVLVLLISFFGVLVLRHAGAGQVMRLRTAAGGDFRHQRTNRIGRVARFSRLRPRDPR